MKFGYYFPPNQYPLTMSFFKKLFGTGKESPKEESTGDEKPEADSKADSKDDSKDDSSANFKADSAASSKAQAEPAGGGSLPWIEASQNPWSVRLLGPGCRYDRSPRFALIRFCISRLRGVMPGRWSSSQRKGILLTPLREMDCLRFTGLLPRVPG
jgi:hypothetical protein